MSEASSSVKSMLLPFWSLLLCAGNLRKGSGTVKRGGTKRLSKLFEPEEFCAEAGGDGGLLEGGGDGRWKPSVRERTWGL